MSNTTTDRQSSQSAIRLLQIMECLSKNRVPTRLQDLAKQVKMTQSTVLRYLYTLQDENYVYQEADTLRYALTWRVCGLSENVNSLLSLRNITTPFINHLANIFHTGTCLVINEGNECVYLDCIVDSNASLQYIGKRAPLHVTGSGKVLLAQYNDVQLNDYIETKGLAKLTEYTIIDATALRKELEKIRSQDYGMDEEECEIGLRCISFPLRDYSGQVIAAVSVFGCIEDMSDHRIKDEIRPALKEAAATISTRLGYRPEK